MNTREQALRPLRDLIRRLPQLPLNGAHEIDFAAADADLLVVVGDAAEITVNVIHHGVGAVGHLLAHSAVAIEDGSISADCVESLGYLLAEISDLATECMTLAARCRQSTYDYTPLSPDTSDG